MEVGKIGIERNDIDFGTIRVETARTLDHAWAVFADDAIKFLGISSSQMEELVRRKLLPLPGKRGPRVAWRRDEIRGVQRTVAELLQDRKL